MHLANDGIIVPQTEIHVYRYTPVFQSATFPVTGVLAFIENGGVLMITLPCFRETLISSTKKILSALY